MSSQLYNNVSDSLLNSIDDVQTSFDLSSGNIPSVSAGDYIPIHVVRDGDGAFEIMHVTGVSGSTITVDRAAENTSPLTFPSGSVVQVRPTRQSLLEMNSGSSIVETSTGTQELNSALDDRETSSFAEDRSAYVTPEMFGGVADAVISDDNGTTSGTDNTQAFIDALATGLPVIASKGGYYVDELPLSDGQSLYTAGAGFITGPMNKAAIKVGDGYSSTPVQVSNIHVDVSTMHPLLFENATLATNAGHPNGAILTGNKLTAGISHENTKNSYFRLRHRGGRYGITGIHDHDSESTKALPAAGERNENIFFDVETVDAFQGSSLNCENTRGGRAIATNTVLKHDAYNVNGVAVSAPSSGLLDYVRCDSCRVGFTADHGIQDMVIRFIESTNNTHRNVVFSRGTEPIGPKIWCETVRTIGPTDTSQFSLENYGAETTIQNLEILDSGVYGLRNNENSTLTVGNAYVRGGSVYGVYVAGGDVVFEKLRLEDAPNVGVLTSGPSPTTTIGVLEGVSNVGRLFQHSAGSINLGRCYGESSNASIAATGTSGTLLDMDFSGFTGAGDGVTFQEPSSSFRIGRVLFATGQENTYIAPGIIKTFGSGDPEGVVTASVGSEYTRLDPVSSNTIKYVKTSGGGNTGWTYIAMP